MYTSPLLVLPSTWPPRSPTLPLAMDGNQGLTMKSLYADDIPYEIKFHMIVGCPSPTGYGLELRVKTESASLRLAVLRVEVNVSSLHRVCAQRAVGCAENDLDTGYAVFIG